MKPIIRRDDGTVHCPYCNMNLNGSTYNYRVKHIRRCSQRINLYVYSDRQKGRPMNKERREILRQREE